MKRGRRLARTLAFQTLFEIESRPAGLDLQDALTRRVHALEEETGEALGGDIVPFARRLLEGTLAACSELDERIARTAPAFPLHQMALTDRVALELALYELLHEPSSPMRVVINEAVELAKTYGGESSGRFVNGVLGTIAGEQQKRDQTATPSARPAEREAHQPHH